MAYGTVIVLGGSFAGLLAAAAAARHAREVIVIERDALQGLDGPRKGVPQGRHNHNLFAGGRAIAERLLPGLTDELRARGASVIDSGLEGRWTIGGHRLARVAIGHEAIFASRPCIDASMLARAGAITNVTIADRTDVLGVVGDERRIRGVRVAARDEESGERTIDADLVLDATGRGSRTPTWLGALGVAAPARDELEVRMAYATRCFRRAPGDLGGDRSLLVSAVPPDRVSGGVAFAVEGDRWMVLLYGYGGTKPPVELEGFRAYARTVSPDLAELVARAEPEGEGAAFTYPRAVRHRYDRIDTPEGLWVIGDALSSTNPSWGSGMTSAALQAEALEPCLARRVRARDWHRAAIAASDPIWQQTTWNDLAFDCVPGEAPAPARWIAAYVRALASGATTDPVLARAMIRMIDKVAAPASILAPSIVLRVVRAALAPAPAPGSRMLRA